jgi:hypothetical protein
VRPGDRVGIYLRKSIDAVAAIYGILKAGAAYVPVDPGAPPARNAYILHNCAVNARGGGAPVRSDAARRRGATAGAPPARDRSTKRAPAARAPGARGRMRSTVRPASHRGSGARRSRLHPVHLGVDRQAQGRDALARERHELRRLVLETFRAAAPTTGFPRTRRSTSTSRSWTFTCAQARRDAGAGRRGHRQGAGAPRALIAEQKISVWYSAPSILALLAQYGNLERHDYSALRLVLFAGEVFAGQAPAHAVRTSWPRIRVTSICTGRPRRTSAPSTRWCRRCPEERTAPYPIGKVCSHLRPGGRRDGARRAPGPRASCASDRAGVMQGYWALPEQTAGAFLVGSTARAGTAPATSWSRRPTAATPTAGGATAW